ncbi:MAG: hypothetical protein M3438_00845 [Pseudomonadota bacterium]|nr:hypothetical protein [Pseudomonadota bacterium]
MTGKRARIALAATVMALLAGVVLALARPASTKLAPRPAGERPELMLLTTLPIVFADELTLDAPASATLEALQSRYRVVPISVTAAYELGKRKLLLMAQPQAQPAEALVELDAWVRAGGRVLLLADPALEWASDRPLGDLLRPPLAFADTGLLGHWGLRLDGPNGRGPASRTIDGREVRTVSAGALTATKPACATVAQGLVARCRLGEGRAVVIADADLLNVEAIEGAGKQANYGLLLEELARLEQ